MRWKLSDVGKHRVLIALIALNAAGMINGIVSLARDHGRQTGPWFVDAADVQPYTDQGKSVPVVYRVDQLPQPAVPPRIDRSALTGPCAMGLLLSAWLWYSRETRVESRESEPISARV